MVTDCEGEIVVVLDTLPVTVSVTLPVLVRLTEGEPLCVPDTDMVLLVVVVAVPVPVELPVRDTVMVCVPLPVLVEERDAVTVAVSVRVTIEDTDGVLELLTLRVPRALAVTELVMVARPVARELTVGSGARELVGLLVEVHDAEREPVGVRVVVMLRLAVLVVVGERERAPVKLPLAVLLEVRDDEMDEVPWLLEVLVLEAVVVADCVLVTAAEPEITGELLTVREVVTDAVLVVLPEGVLLPSTDDVVVPLRVLVRLLVNVPDALAVVLSERLPREVPVLVVEALTERLTRGELLLLVVVEPLRLARAEPEAGAVPVLVREALTDPVAVRLDVVVRLTLVLADCVLLLRDVTEAAGLLVDVFDGAWVRVAGAVARPLGDGTTLAEAGADGAAERVPVLVCKERRHRS